MLKVGHTAAISDATKKRDCLYHIEHSLCIGKVIGLFLGPNRVEMFQVSPFAGMSDAMAKFLHKYHFSCLFCFKSTFFPGI